VWRHPAVAKWVEGALREEAAIGKYDTA
jgi:hypothetical protein